MTVVAPIMTVAAPEGSEWLVYLPQGTANLTRHSVVNCRQVFTVPKSLLSERLGALPPELLREVVDGVKRVFG